MDDHHGSGRSDAVRVAALAGGALPLLVSVPHAGRLLPSRVQAASRVSLHDLSRLSDSWADFIAAPLLERGATVIMARMQRAVADCNRHEGEMDPADVVPSLRPCFGPPGRKARAGLGVVPTRLAPVGQLWSQPLNAAEFEYRLELAHRPFHAQLTGVIQQLLRRHKMLVLIDLHSMPPLPITSANPRPAQIIVGDRFGKAAASGLAAAIAARNAPQGARRAVNQPYAGGHIIERHGAPAMGVHALQVEFDRRLYLDSDGSPNVERALELGEWLADASMDIMDRIGFDASLPLAAE